MPAQYAFGPGDGPGPNSLDLYDNAGIKVLSWDAPPPDDGATTRTVTVRLHIRGADTDACWGHVSALNRMLGRARRAAGAGEYGQRVTFGMLPLNVTEWTYLDVVDGSIGEVQRHPRGEGLFTTLTLICLPLGRGATTTTENLLLNTQAFGSWSLSNVTVGNDATTAPDGATTADRLVETSATGDHSAFQAVTLVNGQDYTFSVYAKADQRSQLSVVLFPTPSYAAFAYSLFDLAAGSVVWTSAGSAEIEAVGGGWYRCTVRGTATGTAAETWVQLAHAGSLSYSGNTANGLYLWGAQLSSGTTRQQYQAVGSSALLTAGANCYVDLAIDGDEPAVLELTITDESTNGEILNDVIVAVATTGDEDASEYQPIHDLTATGSGSSQSVTDAIGGSVVEATPNGDWQTIAYVDGPDLAATKGPMDLMLRGRDAYSASEQPTVDFVTAMAAGHIATWGATGFGVTSLTSMTLTWSRRTKRGSTLVLFLGWRGSPTVTIPGWTSVASAVQGTGGTATRSAVYVIDNAAPQEGTFSVGFSVATFAHAYIVELPYMAVSAVDKTAAGTSSASTSVSAASGTLTQANELIMSVAMSSVNSTPTVNTSPSGGTTQYNSSGGFAVGRKSVTATTSTTFQTSGSSGNWATCVVSFYQRVNAVPNVNAGLMTIRAAPVAADGTIGVASDPHTSFPGSGATFIVMTEPASGPPDHYRLYFDRGAGSKYLDTPDASEVYILMSESGLSDGDPILESDLAYVRLLLSLPSGTSTVATLPVQFPVGSNAWRWFTVAAGEWLPPVLAQDGQAPQEWRMAVQLKRQVSTVHAVQVDAIATLPHPDGEGSAQAEFWYPGYTLSTKRKWIAGTRRDGKTFGFLQQLASTTDAGHLQTDHGQLIAGPGNVRLFMLLAGAGLIADVTDLKVKIAIRITSFYLYLRDAS